MALTKPSLFFATMKATLLGPTLDQGEVDGCNAILAAMDGAPLSHAAYALATAFLETNGTMKPVREAYWLSTDAAERYFHKMYDIAGARPAKAKELGNLCAGDGVKYCGRGYVQLTGRTNYQRAEDETGEPLIEHPSKAMEPEVAAKIMRHGMTEGWFTTKKFSSYLPAKGPADRAAFKKCRYIINGQDRAADVAGFALMFQTGLQAGGWQ